MGTNMILQPVIALVLWTMLIWLWMYVTRIPAMGKAKIDTANMVGGTGKDLDNALPAQVQWKAHNYNHLLDEPTLFYAVALSLALLGAGDGFNVTLAWAYVGLRVLHSLIQTTVNRVMFRFLVFALSSIVLIWLAINAALVAF
ncbi:MAG: MAPEG family protein [Parasphingopyxis sp.]|uniref:MAPEG family protein n=1 Tax=Parasphingopyxis sp. TaxID=1920299 RepID=UPI00262E948C|nr:MAPEG family protein [uncultured Parasphingopyxis sp.]